MIDNKIINEELKTLATLQALTKVYGEIASTRMKRTRNAVVASRQYLEAIYNIFEEVRLSYAKLFQKLAHKKKLGRPSDITFLAHNGKKVAVLLSSDIGLYGEIIPETFKLFLSYLRASDCEVTIVGKQGLGLFLSSGESRLYTFFDFPKKDDEFSALSKIISHIVQYEEIWLYYGKFLSVVSQKPTQQIITSVIPLSGEKKGVKRTQFIFEPSLEKILMFFETEIFATIFDHAFREGQLAKYASRILAMDKASQNIDRISRELVLKRLRITHAVQNRKQLNSLPAIATGSPNGRIGSLGETAVA